MKVEIEILPDQLELLKKIQELPGLIDAHVGKLPDSFPSSGTSYLDSIKHNCVQLEFAWKKWAFDTVCLRSKFAHLFDGVKLASSFGSDWDE